jgi:Fur family transcriptional regulator, zinc uptake regulator
MTFPHPQHDHQRCVEGALAAADAECRRRGARLTDIRRRVLELVWRSHAPIGAYALLQDLGKAAPPTVYRALDFLMAHGLIHRIEKLNAYVGCAHPGHGQTGQFLVCAACGAALELNDAGIIAAIEQAAAAQGFSIAGLVVEAEGLCPSCRNDAP